MHLRFSLAAAALIGLCSSVSFVQAQEELPGYKQDKTTVGLVDVGFLIQNHPTMKGEMESIKAEMTKAQEEIDARRKELMQQSDQVSKTYDSASPDFKQKQEELINKESRLRVDFMDKEKEYAERHATLLAKSYNDISLAISQVATGYQFDLILRYSKEQNEMDPKKPRTVEFGIQKDVLYQAPGMDLTPHAMWVLKRNLGVLQTQATQATQPAAQTATRPAAQTSPARATR